MEKIYETERHAKVAAVNKAHRLAVEVRDRMRDFFQDYVGQKVLKQDGSFLKKIQDQLPKILTNEPYHSLRYTRNILDFSLAWTIIASARFKGAYPGDSRRASYEITIYVGDLMDEVLTGLSNIDPLRCDYSIEELDSKLREYDEAKKRLRQIESELHPFNP